MEQANYITDYFDLSIVLIADKTTDFNLFLHHNANHIQQNGIELVVVCHAEMKEASRHIADRFPFLNLKIVSTDCTDFEHNIRTCYKYVSNKYVLLLDINCKLAENSLYSLIHLLFHQEKRTVITGNGTIDDIGTLLNGEVVLPASFIVGRKSIIADHFFQSTNMVDHINFLSAHLSYTQTSKVLYKVDHNIKTYEKLAVKSDTQEKATNSTTHEAVVNSQSITEELIHDYQIRNHAKIITLLKDDYEKFEITNECLLSKQLNLICLVQVKDEANYLPGLFANLDLNCDGIILLDDQSADGSYDVAMHDKLLLKARKKKSKNDHFNDLENRNHLLRLSWIFRSKWLFFIDADERIDPRYADLKSLCNQVIFESISFRMVHLWNEENKYRVDLPEGKNGVISRSRMFKVKGYLQIRSTREIHFRATPYKRNHLKSNILLLHYGLMDYHTRQIKYNRYMSQDRDAKKQNFSYSYLLDQSPLLKQVSDLKLTEKKYKQ